MRLTHWIIPLSLLVASTSNALPPGAAERGLREGANHHTGDDSFVEEFGRAPRAGDDEKLRMRVHFAHVRAWLASRPATRPELQAKRDQLLAFLDEYIAHGITPKNIDLAWRTPVFIDHDNTICAVGYLIERSVGRALPAKIAATHRFSYIEDIARVMPEVRAWVDASGLTLEEIASIQPGYEGPEIDQYQRWVLAKMANGPYAAEESGFAIAGRFRLQQMHGEWTKTADQGTVRGIGTFAMGSGTWRSNFKTGARMAEGRFVDSRPTGTWRFYHPSGNLAAEGRLEGTRRRGAWRFFYDTVDTTVFAMHDFDADGWKFFDQAGAVVVSQRSVAPKRWGRTGWGTLTTVEPGADGVRRVRHTGGVSAPISEPDSSNRWSSTLDGYTIGDERVYEHEYTSADHDPVTRTYDADGNQLEHGDGGWRASDCRWSVARKHAARTGDVATLNGLLGAKETTCGKPIAVPSDRAARIDAALATRHRVRAPIPEFVEAIANYENDPPTASETDLGAATPTATPVDEPKDASDLVGFVLTTATDHFDTRFIQVFRTIPGTRHRFE